MVKEMEGKLMGTVPTSSKFWSRLSHLFFFFRFALPNIVPFVDSLRQISDISWLVCFSAHFAQSEFKLQLLNKSIYFEPSQYQNMRPKIETRTHRVNL